MLRLLLGTLVSTLLFGALILAPAYVLTGHLNWPRGWLVVGVFFVVNAAGGLYFFFTSPELVRERAKAPQTKTLADTAASLFIFLAVVAFCMATAYDSLSLHVLQLGSGISLGLGLAVFAIGLAVIIWTFRVNAFATTVVEVQEARNQHVIQSGPYRLVRHPMYFGAIWFFAGVALMLGSPAMALAAIVLFPIAFLPRMLVEERVLGRELAGYREYQSRVRSRILPSVF
jgi:protein-S-isoprenylcysteine O-methyltransferase Ste14